MTKKLEKYQQSHLNRSWLAYVRAAFLSLFPKSVKNQPTQITLLELINFIELKNIKERNLLLEQYRILTEHVNRTSENRENLNSFWITLNGVILGGISYVQDMQIDNPNPKNLFIWMLVFFGFLLSIFWAQILGKIKKDIEIKNEMVMEMEKFLPAKIFTASFQIKARAQEKGSISSTERSIPLLFCIGYGLIAIILLCYPNIM